MGIVTGVGLSPRLQPALRHAFATSSTGALQPSPSPDLTHQYTPNAWRHTVFVSGGQTLQRRFIGAGLVGAGADGAAPSPAKLLGEGRLGAELVGVVEGFGMGQGCSFVRS